MGKWWVTDEQRKAERPLISADANRAQWAVHGATPGPLGQREWDPEEHHLMVRAL